MQNPHSVDFGLNFCFCFILSLGFTFSSRWFEEDQALPRHSDPFTSASRVLGLNLGFETTF